MIPIYKPRGKGGEVQFLPPPSYTLGRKWFSLTDANDIVWVTNTGGYIEKYVPATLGTTVGDISATATIVSTPTSDFTIGMATDGTYLYLISLNKTGITKLNLDGTFVAHYLLGKGLQTILFDGTNLWVGDSHAGLIYKVNTSGVIISTTITNSDILSMAFDGTFLWATLFTANRVVKINTSGSIINSFDFGVAPVGVAFDGNDLWVTLQGTQQFIYTGWVTNGGKLLKIDKATGTITNTYTLSDALAYVTYFSDTATLGVTSTSDHTYKEVSLAGAVLTNSVIGLNPRNATRDSYGYTYIAGYGDDTVFRVPIEGLTTLPLPSLLLHLTSTPPTDSSLPSLVTAITYSSIVATTSSTLFPDGNAIVVTTTPSGTFYLNVSIDTTTLDLTKITVRFRMKVANTINQYLDFVNGWVATTGGFFAIGAAQIPTSTVCIPDHSYIVSVEYLSGTMYLYIDGTLIGSTVATPGSFDTLRINGFSGGGSPSHAMTEITEFAVFYGTCLVAPATSYTVETSRYLP